MTLIYIWIAALIIAIGFFAKNYYNSCKREKKLDRLKQERIRRNQDRYVSKKK